MAIFRGNFLFFRGKTSPKVQFPREKGPDSLWISQIEPISWYGFIHRICPNSREKNPPSDGEGSLSKAILLSISLSRLLLSTGTLDASCWSHRPNPLSKRSNKGGLSSQSPTLETSSRPHLQSTAGLCFSVF